MAKKKATTNRSSKKLRSSSAPGTYRGFSLQANRFLAHLLTAEMDDTVCLEAFEDVGVESEGGNRVAEQSKSFLSQNPVADRSLQLWKTLANWVMAARAGTLSPNKTRFVLYSHNKGLGAVAQRFHDANRVDTAVAAIAFTKQHLGYPNGLSDHDETRRHMRFVLDADETIVAGVLSRFTIESGSLVGTDELTQLFSAELISSENRDETIQWAHGWVKQRIDEQVAKNVPCRIAKKEFHAALLNFVRTHDRLSILKSFAGDPDETQVEVELQFRKYVRQLRCIGLDEVDVLSAVNDYLRAVVDRTRWSQDGYITAVALDTLADELIQTWRNKRRRTSLSYPSLPEEQQGQLLYTDCIEHAAKLDGLETPLHFIRGNWHALADDAAIGWHPRFAALLAATDGKDATPEKGGTP